VSLKSGINAFQCFGVSGRLKCKVYLGGWRELPCDGFGDSATAAFMFKESRVVSNSPRPPGSTLTLPATRTYT